MQRTLVLITVLFGSAFASVAQDAKSVPLAGQIMVDPDNAAHLVYNRDTDGDGRLDPFFMVGPGDPEGFLYLGERRADGTRAGNRQEDILARLVEHGGNGVYFQAVRSHGGDGPPDHNPWQDPADPASGLNPKIIAQWKGWFDTMRDAGIVLFFFIYDDGAHPFDDGCAETVGSEEEAFLRALITAFSPYPNLIWVVQEEFKFVGHAGQRRPCDAARIEKIGQIARLVRKFDPHAHPIGVHHNVGDPMAFPDHPDIDVYVQQANVRPAVGRANLATLHEAGMPGSGFDPQRRYVYIMGEGYDWHPKLMAAQDRTMLRKTYYATAMAGGHVTVLGMFPTEEGAEPTDEMLRDMRRTQRFFESIPFNTLAPHDELAHGDTDWVLANAEAGRYVLYTHDGGARLGVRGLKQGRHTLRWYDPATGAEVVLADVEAGGDATFAKPESIGAEAIVYIRSE